MKPKLIFVGDAAVQSGFANCTHAYLSAMLPAYDVTVLGLNYRGDPYDYPYPIYAALAGGDPFGVGRLVWTCDLVTRTRQEGQKRIEVPQAEWRKPDVIVIQNDPWNFPIYLEQLKRKDGTYEAEYADVPVVGVVAVDGKNCRGDGLIGLSLAIFWTQFGLDEARKGGYDGPAVVIPLGVDLNVYHPSDKVAARRRQGMSAALDDAFIVGNVNRNQPRKRFDLTIRYFAEWMHHGPLRDAYLYLHVAPTGDLGVDVPQLAAYYGVARRTILSMPPEFYGVTNEEMCNTYNCFDVQVNTGQGEGFGLTTLEGMACGVPQIVGDWSALGEWATAAVKVPCTATAINTVHPRLNTIGGVLDEKLFVAALDDLYRNKDARRASREAGLRLASEDRFRWDSVGEKFRLVVNHVLREHVRARREVMEVSLTEDEAADALLGREALA